MITQAELKESVCYDADTGVFTWRVDTGRYGRIKAGTMINTHGGRGWLQGQISGKKYMLHRLAFLYMTGSFPDIEVDHINHVRDDNRWTNLRLVSRQENTRNAGISKTNTSGVTGVSFIKKDGKWQATISNGVKNISLGLFGHIFDAICARKSAEKRFNFHANHGRDFAGGYSNP